MTREDAFLLSLLTDPDDDTTRLVFADWLEEQGEPRAGAFRAYPEVCSFLAALGTTRPRTLNALLKEIDDHAAAGRKALLRGLAQVLEPFGGRADLQLLLPRKIRRVLDHLSEYGFTRGRHGWDSPSRGRFPLTDAVAAGTFVAGLTLGVVAHGDVIAWTDRQIEARKDVPAWVIGLSLSAGARLDDALSPLRRLAETASPLDICRALYSLLPEVSDTQPAKAERLANILYGVARGCLEGDWSYQTLRRTDSLRDSFILLREEYSVGTPEQSIRQLGEFVAEHQDNEARAWLDPVRIQVR
jgi:uncharacterized protein (TIGR02996 family)